MPRRKVKYYGSDLKKRLLQALVDPETGMRYSVREAIRLHPELCIPISNWNYYCKKDEVKNAKPFAGEIITEELAWKYYESLGFNELSEEDFTNSTKKIKNKLDEETLMRMNEMEILDFTQSNIFSLSKRKETLVIACGNEDYYNQVNEENKKKLLAR